MAGSATHHRIEKDPGQEALGRWLYRGFGAGLLVAMALLLTPAVRAADDLKQLQEKFDRETDGVRKAKQLQKLGDAQFNKERESAKANDYTAVGLEMEKYRDNVRAAIEALKKTQPDAEKHSAGYRQLEMHVGTGIREIRDVILAVPEPYRPPMQLVEQDLKEMDGELLRLLFPRRPGEQKTPPAASKPQPPEAMENQP